MNSTLLLMQIDDMPTVGDATIGLLRYAAKKEKAKRFNRQAYVERNQPLQQTS